MANTPQAGSSAPLASAAEMADAADAAYEQAVEVRDALARASGAGTAARGDVRVTVGFGGRLTGVTINDRAMELSGEALGAEIMAATSLAEEAAAREVRSITDSYYPDSEIWQQYEGQA